MFLNLVPSENFTSEAVLDALGSVMQGTSCLSNGIDWCHSRLSNLDYQAATQKATREHAITAETIFLTKGNDCARNEHLKLSV